MALETVL